MGEKVRFVVNLLSPRLGSRPDEMYITENKVIFGAHEVKIDDITNVRTIPMPRMGLRSIFLIVSNMVLGTLLAFVTESTIPVAIAVILLSGLLGLLIVKFVNDKPFTYVALETESTEYRFGLEEQMDVAKLFGTVKGEKTPDVPLVNDEESETELSTND